MTVTDQEKLIELMKAIHELTGIKVAIYNTDCVEVLAYPVKDTPFCEMMRWRSESTNACNLSEHRRCEFCRQKGTAQILQCHAGLTELVAPLLNGNATIGYIMAGQVTNVRDKTGFLDQVMDKCRLYGFDRDEVKRRAEQVRYYSDQQLFSVLKIISVMASYIVFSDLLYPEQTPLHQSILDYIAKNLSADLSITALCERFSVSKAELYRLLRTSAPDGVAAYIRQLRMNKACDLLRNTDKPIWRIAEEIGCDDQNYFMRIFKKTFGLSAGRYRKSARNGSDFQIF